MSEELTWLPAWRIRELIGKREVSPVEVTEHFLGRIEEHDPTLKAFKTVDAAGAREQAKRAEQAVQAGDTLGPLHGVPTAVKEHIAVAGLPVMGLGGAEEVVAKRDALGVERLRDAGAVIVGTNTMMGTSGGGLANNHFNWEAEARNPWDPTRVPGWSSSGPAAAAVAALLPFTIGSDGGGSTRLPAAYSGVVGVHPTASLIPTVSYEPRLPGYTGSIGPMARNVVDTAIVLQAMAGPDGRDVACLPVDPPDYLARIDAGLEGVNIAWTDDYGFTDVYAVEESPRVIEAVRSAAMGLSSIGANVTTTDEVWEDYWEGLVMTNWLSAANVAPAPDKEVWRLAIELRQRNWSKFRKVLKGNDVLLSPTSQILAPKVEDWDSWWTKDGARFEHGTFAGAYCSHTFMFNWLAFPAVSVPCGFVDGLPVGLQIVGLPGTEDKIFRVANAFQKAFPRDERPTVS